MSSQGGGLSLASLLILAVYAALFFYLAGSMVRRVL